MEEKSKEKAKKKPYAEPEFEKREQLTEITEGGSPGSGGGGNP